MSRIRPRNAAIPIIDPSDERSGSKTESSGHYEPSDSSKDGQCSTQVNPSTAPQPDNAAATVNSQHITAIWSDQTSDTPAPITTVSSAEAASIVQSGQPARLHTPSPWSPDIYARPYIPAYLFAINRSPALVKHSQPLRTINYESYVQQFAGQYFLKPLGASQMPAIKHVPVSVSRYTKNLKPSSYLYYFDECLLLESYNHSVDISELSLYNVGITTVDVTESLYDVHIPGLKDDAPCVELGDIVPVRQIFQSPQLTAQGAEWLANNEHALTGSVAPGFNGLQLNAVVMGVSRAKETIRLRIRKFLPCIPAANISFTIQDNSYVPLWEAITRIVNGSSWPLDTSVAGKSTDGIQNEGNWCRRMLFPEKRHGTVQSTLPSDVFEHKWVDAALNYEQMRTIDSITRRNYGNVPFLISGVPGSGKTKTVVECALQLLQTTEEIEPHILLCAPSNPAADTLALRLSKHLTPRELFRLNGWSRTFAEVPDALMPYTFAEDDVFSLPSFKKLKSYRIVVTTCKDADMLVKARLTNRDLMKLAYETVSTFCPGVAMKPEQALHWTTILIDEAAQATEPAVCVPLTVVATPLKIEPSPDGKSSLPLFIMAGDEHQLSPRVYNHDTALSVSLFERLLSRPFYAEHPLSRRNAGPYKKLTQEMLPMLRPAFSNLTRNYRSHPALLPVPSILFYSDTLIPCAAKLHPDGPVPTWPEWKSPHGWPVLFSCNTSLDDVENVLHRPAGSGVYNRGEALKALYYAQSLLKHSDSLDYEKLATDYQEQCSSYPPGFYPTTPPKPVVQEDIAVITPFRAQVAHLRNVFRAYSLHGVNIGPLEAFQGLETRFLIICTTRTRTQPDFVRHDQSVGLGLVGEKKRLNVALTRSKEGIVVIGNPNVLVDTGKDEAWRTFLSFCARNGCWAPEELPATAESNGKPKTNPPGGSKQNTHRDVTYWMRRLAGLKDVGENANGAASATSNEDDDILTDSRLSGYVSRLERDLLRKDGTDSPGNSESGAKQLGSGVLDNGDADGYACENDYDSAGWTANMAAESVLKDAF